MDDDAIRGVNALLLAVREDDDDSGIGGRVARILGEGLQSFFKSVAVQITTYIDGVTGGERTGMRGRVVLMTIGGTQEGNEGNEKEEEEEDARKKKKGREEDQI